MRIVVLFDSCIFWRTYIVCEMCVRVLFHRTMMDRRDGRRGDNILNFWPNHSPLLAYLGSSEFQGRCDEMLRSRAYQCNWQPFFFKCFTL